MEIVNGYVCRDCTDVANAKKNVDPAHPKDGPEGRFKLEAEAKVSARPAVEWGGQLAQLAQTARLDPEQALLRRVEPQSDTNSANRVNLLA